MGIFDAFDSSGGRRAANQAHAATVGGLNSGLNAAKNYTTLARGDITAGRNQALGYLDKGNAAARGDYMSALKPYQALYPTAEKGYGAYADASGVHGAEGYDRARSSFQTGPGYEFMREEGLDALDRRANVRGLLSSGNHSIDTLKYVTGLADQQWDDYVGRLAPYLQVAPQLAGAQADIYQQLADLSRGTGAAKAGVSMNAGSQMSGLYDQLSRLAYGTGAGIGKAGAENAMNRYQADQSASGNLWSALLGLGNLGVSAYGARTPKTVVNYG